MQQMSDGDLVHEAEALVCAAEYASAAGRLRQAIQANPSNRAAHRKLGACITIHSCTQPPARKSTTVCFVLPCFVH